MSRLTSRLRIFGKAIPVLLCKPWRRRPAIVRRVLVVHRLLLGDTLLLAPLLKKLRNVYPEAEIVVTCSPLIAPLFAMQPYGVNALPYNPRDSASVKVILRSGPYDLAIVAGDQRYSWLGLAAGSRWLIAYAAQTAAWKRWPLDETPAYPAQPGAWADAMSDLIDGPRPLAYTPGEWPLAPTSGFSVANPRYAVLHPGASSAVKQWHAERWHRLAKWLQEKGFQPVWSGGPGEAELIARIDPDGVYPSYAGKLDLLQLGHMLRGAALLVCPDTGVAHLGRLVGVPTVALFGPGSALIHGAGEFWKKAPFLAATLADLSCRNQPSVFESTASWIRRCDRDLLSCINRDGDTGACMAGISVADVQEHVITLMSS